MRDQFVARLTELARKDPRIILVTGDLGFGVLTKYAAEFPKQYLNAGVAEQNMTGLATGMALCGRIAFTYSIANFPILRCLEQIRNDAAYHEADVKVVAIGGGFSYGALGMSHHATEDLAILRALPGVTVVSPGCLWEAAEATEAVYRTKGTCYLRLDKSSAGDTSRPGETFELGRMRTLRQGNDLTLIATGGILAEALSAAQVLSESHQLECRVLSAHTLRPFDGETLAQACHETGGVITIEEHGVEGGLAGVVAETSLEMGAPPRRFARIGLRGGYSAIVGSQEYLRDRYEMSAPHIVARALSLLKS